MDDAATEPTGSLYRVSSEKGVTQMLSGFIVTNGIGWSSDNRTMYVTDSENRTILAFDYNGETGEISRRKVFVTVDPGLGLPDGLTVDAEGYVWSAHWNGWRVTRYAPDGRTNRVLSLPVPRPTSSLAVEQRCSSDDRTIDSLFLSASEEIHDISLVEALSRILSLVWNKLRESYLKSEQLVMEIIQTTMKEALALIKPGLFAKCES